MQRRVLLSVSSMFILALPPLQAQVDPALDQEDEEVVRLSNFVVSTGGDDGYFAKNTLMGTRSSERLMDIPQNIQIIPEAVLSDLAQDNGIEVMKYATSGVNRRSLLPDVYLRGFRVTGFLKDGIVSAGGSYMTIPLYDTERIEVIKGPAAMLIGQEAKTGGLINYVSKKALDKRGSSLKTTVASDQFYRIEASATGPLLGSKLDYRVTVAATTADGSRQFEHFEDRFFSTSLLYHVSDTTTASLYYNYYWQDSYQAQRPTDQYGVLLAVSDVFALSESWDKKVNKFHNVTLSLISKFTDSFQMQATLGFNQDDLFWDRAIPIGNANRETGMLQRRYQAVYYGPGNRTMNLTADFLKELTTGPIKHKVSFGGMLRGWNNIYKVDSVNIDPINIYNPVYDTPQPTYVQGVATPGSPGPSSRTDRARQDSLYLHEQMNLLDDRLVLVAGLRYNSFTTSTDNHISGAHSVFHDKALVKRYGAVFKPVPALGVYYNYSESFAFNSGVFVGGPRDGQPLAPSYGENNEVGIKVETSNGRFFGSIAAFDLALTNVRILIVLPDGSGGISQAGQESNRGYEADLGMSLPTALGSLQTIFTFYAGDSKDSAGNKPNGVMNNGWSALVSQEVDQGPLQGLKFGGGAYYKGVVPFASAGGQLNRFIAPDYMTTMAFISFGNDRYSIQLNVDNVLDEEFVEGGENATWLYLNSGRTFKLSGGIRF